MPAIDEVTPFFAKLSAGSTTNSTHTSLVPLQQDNGVRYVLLGQPSDGWVMALASDGNKISLCEYTKVKLLRKVDKRVYFQLLDGNTGAVGSELSMNEAGAIKYLHRTSRKKGITVTAINNKHQQRVISIQREGQELDQMEGELQVNGKEFHITLLTMYPNATNSNLPVLPNGEYKIMAPDAPHTHTERYREKKEDTSYYDTVWFPIEYKDNSRYLHIGHVSNGCVTVTNIKKWQAIYRELIVHRSDGNDSAQPGGGKYVGTLQVRSSNGASTRNTTVKRLSAY